MAPALKELSMIQLNLHILGLLMPKIPFGRLVAFSPTVQSNLLIFMGRSIHFLKMYRASSHGIISIEGLDPFKSSESLGPVHWN